MKMTIVLAILLATAVLQGGEAQILDRPQSKTPSPDDYASIGKTIAFTCTATCSSGPISWLVGVPTNNLDNDTSGYRLSPVPLAMKVVTPFLPSLRPAGMDLQQNISSCYIGEGQGQGQAEGTITSTLTITADAFDVAECDTDEAGACYVAVECSTLYSIPSSTSPDPNCSSTNAVSASAISRSGFAMLRVLGSSSNDDLETPSANSPSVPAADSQLLIEEPSDNEDENEAAVGGRSSRLSRRDEDFQDFGNCSDEYVKGLPLWLPVGLCIGLPLGAVLSFMAQCLIHLVSRKCSSTRHNHSADKEKILEEANGSI